MSKGSRFADLSRAARRVVGLAEDESLTIVANVEQPGSQAAAEPTPPEEEEEEEEEVEEQPKAAKTKAPAIDATDPAIITATTEQTVRAEERQRMADVFASEHVKGREAAAVMLLTETDMTAEKIVAKLPTLSPAAAADPMLKNLASTENPDLGAGTEGTTDSKAEAKSTWDRTFERLGWKDK